MTNTKEKTWECKECGKEIEAAKKPGSCSCSCGAHGSWKEKGGQFSWLYQETGDFILWATAIDAPKDHRYFPIARGNMVEMLSWQYDFEAYCLSQGLRLDLDHVSTQQEAA